MKANMSAEEKDHRVRAVLKSLCLNSEVTS